MTSRPAQRHESGAALIIVFWLIALLSLFIFTTMKVVKGDMDVMIGQKKAFRATQLAEMGIAIAVNPTVKETDLALLQRQISEGEGYRARIRGEGAKFNINFLVQRAGSVPDGALFYIFRRWGLEVEEALELVDALIDWTDGDADRRPNGIEADGYEELGLFNYPFNRPFYDVDEVALVRGMDLLIALKPDWRNFFTVYSGGPLDINEADAAQLSLVTGVAEEELDEIVRFRLGEDGIEDTEDDVKFGSVGELQAMLPIPGGEIPLVTELEGSGIAQFVTTEDQTTRIESTGYIHDFQKKIVLIIRNRNNNPEILNREEVPLF